MTKLDLPATTMSFKKMKKLSLILFCFAFVTCANAMDVIYKVSINGDDADDGLTWDTAKRTIQGALAVAEYGDTIWVSEGKYYPTESDNRYRWGGNSDSENAYFSFRLKNGVKIYGGFPQSNNPSFSDRDYSKYATIFSGEINEQDKIEDNSLRIVTIDDENIDDLTILDGITISGGYGSNGCAVFIDNAMPLIRNCTFTNNSGEVIKVANKGGGYISACTFISNSGLDSTSYIINQCGTSNLQIIDTTFDSNQST